MKVRHSHDRHTGIVSYSCDETGRTVLVPMTTLAGFKSTEQLHKHLTDKGLFDKPKYPQHPECESVFDRYAEMVTYRANGTGKSVAIALETLQTLTVAGLDEILKDKGLFRRIVLLQEA